MRTIYTLDALLLSQINLLYNIILLNQIQAIWRVVFLPQVKNFLYISMELYMSLHLQIYLMSSNLQLCNRLAINDQPY